MRKINCFILLIIHNVELSLNWTCLTTYKIAVIKNVYKHNIMPAECDKI